MNKIKNPLHLFALLLVLILSISMSTAAVAWVSPTASTNHSSAITLEVSFVNATDITTPTTANTAMYYSTDSGTTWTEATITSESFEMAATSGSNWTGILGITVISDNADVDFNITLGNSTTNSSGTIITGLTIDDTSPVCTTGDALLQRNFLTMPATQTLTCACTDNLDSSPTHTRTLTKPGSTTVTVTESPYTTARSDINLMGVYTWSCSASDYTGSSDTDTATFRVSSDDDGAGGSTTSTLTNNPMIVIVIVLILIIAVVGVLFAVQSSKKK